MLPTPPQQLSELLGHLTHSPGEKKWYHQDIPEFPDFWEVLLVIGLVFCPFQCGGDGTELMMRKILVLI